MRSRSAAYRAFTMFNGLSLVLLAVLSIFPLVHIAAVSFSSSGAVKAGIVTFYPIDFTLKSYDFILNSKQFLGSSLVSIQRVGLGVATQLLCTLLAAYPLSKESGAFPQRTWYAWIFVFTMLFSGGLIPTFLVVKESGILHSIWALILPGAVPVFNIVLLLNFFRSLPKELEEASYMDGAGHLRTLWQVYIPLAVPGIATVALFSMVAHWNAWFDGLIYIRNPEDYPLSTYMQSILKFDVLSTGSLEMAKAYEAITSRSIRAAQTLVSVLPILLVYPFLQKYFISGLMLGSVKE